MPRDEYQQPAAPLCLIGGLPARQIHRLQADQLVRVVTCEVIADVGHVGDDPNLRLEQQLVRRAHTATPSSSQDSSRSPPVPCAQCSWPPPFRTVDRAQRWLAVALVELD